MQLKEIWKDKVDDVDDVLAEDINSVAHQSIQNADDISALSESFNEEKEKTSALSTKVDEETERVNEELSKITKTANNSFANAIKGTASGAVVRVDDVSPVAHEVNVKVRSKNLLPYPFAETTLTRSGITFTDNGDGTITVNGTATGRVIHTLVNYGDISLVAGESYTLSGCVDGGSLNDSFRLTLQDDSYISTFHDVGNSVTNTAIDGKYGLFIVITAGVTVSNAVFKPQLESGTVATEYTPYADPTSVTLTRCGKNLLINKKGDATIAGIVWTVNEDGTLNASGTIGPYVSDYYFFGGTTENEDSFVAPCDLVLSTSYEHDYANNVFGARTSAGLLGTHTTWENHFIIPAGTRVDGVFLRVCDKTISQQNIECQMEIGTTKTEYEAYRGQNFTPNADGTVEGVTSILPTMTLMTDNNGAIIEAEYNKDTNKVIEELTNAIISLGGNI